MNSYHLWIRRLQYICYSRQVILCCMRPVYIQYTTSVHIYTYIHICIKSNIFMCMKNNDESIYKSRQTSWFTYKLQTKNGYLYYNIQTVAGYVIYGGVCVCVCVCMGCQGGQDIRQVIPEKETRTRQILVLKVWGRQTNIRYVFEVTEKETGCMGIWMWRKCRKGSAAE